jgi:ATP-dependent 26S proteasome regulatory subunit
MKPSVSGVCAYGSSAILAYVVVRGGYTVVHSQLSNPYFGGVLWPLSVGGALLAIIVSAIVTLAVLLEVLESIEPPRLLDRTTYTLVGGAGLIGSSVGTIRTVISWGTAGGFVPSFESGAALVVIVAPIAYASYRLWRPRTDPTPSPATTDEDGLEPQFVRDKTMQWASDEQNRHQSASDSSTLTMTPEEARSKYRQESHTNQGASIDLTELEFDWAEKSGVDFDDVGGMEDIKIELERDVIKPLTTHREKAAELGVTPSNIIFHGPPGTGKTFLAQALATELELPFVKLSGSDVQSKWINESSQKVQALFEEAEAVAEEAGGAVVFLDELDSVLKNRGAGQAHEEDTKVVNEFLNRLENTDEHNVVFIGATNRLESLDEAGIRSGRIDKKIHIGMPGCESRASILKAQLADRPHCLTEDQIRTVAEQTDGMTAADLTSLVEEAAKNSLFRKGDDEIAQGDMQQALID